MTTTRITSRTCNSCEGFEVERPATCTAQYLPSRQNDTRFNRREDLCAPCASNTMIYCDVRDIASVTCMSCPATFDTVAESIGHPCMTPSDAPEEPIAAPPTFPSWYQRLLDLDMTCEDWKNFEAKAYLGYTRYCGSMHEAPMDLDKWLSRFRLNPIEVLFYQNDSRHDLASRVNSYTRIIGVLFP